MNRILFNVVLFSFTELLSGCTGSFQAARTPQAVMQASDSHVMVLAPPGVAVGIGTTSPLSTLTVEGPSGGMSTFSVLNPDWVLSSKGSGITFGLAANSGDTAGTIAVSNSGGKDWGSLAIAPYGGNVGIGTSVPHAKLDVADATIRALDSSTQYPPSSGSGLEILSLSGTGYMFEYNRSTSAYGPLDIVANPLYLHGSGGGGITVVSSGSVGIGTTAPTSTLTVAGTISATSGVTAPSFTMSSDKRLKENVRPLSNELDKIQMLNPIEFNWNSIAKKRGIDDSSRQLGFIAQDVESVFPEAVKTDADGYKTVNYAILISPLIAAFKEVAAENKAKDLKIRDLEKRLEKLEQKK